MKCLPYHAYNRHTNKYFTTVTVPSDLFLPSDRIHPLLCPPVPVDQSTSRGTLNMGLGCCCSISRTFRTIVSHYLHSVDRNTCCLALHRRFPPSEQCYVVFNEESSYGNFR